MAKLNHILLCLILLVGAGTAADQVERKVARREEPQYPEIARKLNLHGMVRLKIWINSDGTVRRLEYVGGHPLLAESALKAVKGWKYEAGPKESTAAVELKF